MLVLSRKPNESIQIGKQIRITVTRIHGNRVCLGIEAPKELTIRRAELEILTEGEIRQRSLPTPMKNSAGRFLYEFEFQDATNAP